MALRVLLFVLFSFAALASAEVRLNAECELPKHGQLSGTSANDGFVIASLSKIFATYWALSHWSPTHQFTTMVHVTALSGGRHDVHLTGGADPTFGREMSHYLASELSRRGVKKIRRLSFDENFVLGWFPQVKVINKVTYYYDFSDLAGSESMISGEAAIRDNLKKHLVPRKNEYAVTLAKAAAAGLAMEEKISFKAPETVRFVAASEHSAEENTESFLIKSVPLLRLLWHMNVTSNNYLADVLFARLGGANAWSEFVTTSPLAEHLSTMDIRNGSGYPIKNQSGKFYNSSSCASVLHALELIDDQLTGYGLSLSAVFPVATSDKSTLDRYELPPDIMIAKTGTVNPTITIAGMIQTENGPLYFSRFLGTDTSNDWPQARTQIKDYLLTLIETRSIPLNHIPQAAVFWPQSNSEASLYPPL